MNLKVPGTILPLGCAILSTREKTVRGVGTTPLRRTRVNALPSTCFDGINQTWVKDGIWEPLFVEGHIPRLKVI